VAKLKILTYPDKALKKKSLWIEEITPDIEKLAIDMLETMYAAPGIGFAAPQAGILKRIIVMDVFFSSEEGAAPIKPPSTVEEILSHSTCKVFINPEVIEASPILQECEEGCLSVPGFAEVVERPEKIKVSALLLDGCSVEFDAEELFAVCIQHEIDHLDGKLFIDRISSLKRNIIQKKIKNEIKQQVRKAPGL